MKYDSFHIQQVYSVFFTFQNSSHEKLFQPFLCMSEFLKPQRQEDITLFDVASGKLDHINLKQVVRKQNHISFCVIYNSVLKLNYRQQTYYPSDMKISLLMNFKFELQTTHFLQKKWLSNYFLTHVLNVFFNVMNSEEEIKKKKSVK